MLLVVGLGNPGDDYARNRHNIGFMAVDRVVRRHSFGTWRGKYQGDLAEGEIAGRRVLALKPMTYMNRSGQAVAACAKFLKIPPADILVVHDDLELAPGKLRVKTGGGHAGHNGLRDIDAHMGKDYRRLRLGIGRPHDKALVHAWVLSDFAKAEQEGLDRLLDSVAANFSLLVQGDDGGFMTRVALDTQPDRPKKAKAAPPVTPPAGPPPGPVPTPGTALADALRKALGKDAD
jgi:PTH1 family peptidyl-tRNA hydrolase